MPIVRLVAEGIGPFDRLDMDFSDGHGNPHLGPHILPGVNGSGKSTVLRTIAWVLSGGGREQGFPAEDFNHLLNGVDSKSILLMRRGGLRSVKAAGRGEREEAKRGLSAWVSGFTDAWPPANPPDSGPIMDGNNWLMYSLEQGIFEGAAYSPSPSLRHVEFPDLTRGLSGATQNALAFGETEQNDQVHSWLYALRSKIALAKEEGNPSLEFRERKEAFERAISEILDVPVQVEVELSTPLPQPRLGFRGQRLNFSQLPDGVRNVLGWLADFLNRLELSGQRSGVLLIDEIDAHLHPRWQRQILPALRKALPEVQIIVSSHSPFVINSCEGARVHVLTADNESGRARLSGSIDAPYGQSFNAALHDVFGVDSRFDARTEADLNEWNKLKRQEAAGRLSAKDRAALLRLTADLAGRSEELRRIVAPQSLALTPKLAPRANGEKRTARKPQRSAR